MKRNIKRHILFLTFTFSLLCLSSLTYALAPWTGKVVGIKDGDTIEVMHQGKAERIRLAEIDCPEKSQPFGSKAKQFTSDLCFAKVVTVKPVTIDRYGRTVGQVILPDGRSLNEELLNAGLAWHYKKYSTDQTLAALEIKARSAQQGLWTDPHAVPPWEWRANGRAPKTEKVEAQQTGTVFHGNVKSGVFHRPGCRYYDCKNCTAVFKSREEATKAGYRPCKVCNP